ncbi:ABC transporter substrate-binding protein [Nocardioides mangrovicus]|uniref:ABC transporter substrate-binding protein n=1 Tax=Nocardioides mangrovicus TaxID=2478913 RepID=A0A3L8P3R8_9ACTN|nr:ABC transporter substrate-binding protein [Nocardioides mangrovicus]RLV49068.1 ABC transporter substrate-binding protein [Nocardioides mangrovicus]
MAAPGLAACGSPAAEARFASTTSSPPASSRQGGLLRVGPLGDGGNYDPTTNLFDYPQMPLSSIFEGLTSYPIGRTQWRPLPQLATAVVKSADQLTYRFQVREGVQFHGGFGELTAADVKYSFERAAGLIPLYPGAPKASVSYYGSDFAGLQGVTTTGRYTGEIHFAEPFVPFETITMPFATSGWITSEKAIAEHGAQAGLHPIGTGPYEVVSYEANSHMTLRRFAGYHGHNRMLGARNAFDEIELLLSPSNGRSTGQALTVPIESGEVDFTDTLGALDVGLLAGDRSYTAYRAQQPLNYFFLAMDVRHRGLEDARVRRAIRTALDVDEINLANRVLASSRLQAPVPPQLETGFWAAAPTRRRDLAAARALLREARAESLSLTIATPNIAFTSGDPTAVMQVIQSNLKDVGIDVEVVQTAPDSFVTDPGRGALLWANFAGAPDPYYQLEWFACDQIGVWNYAAWCDKTYSSMLQQLGTTTDPIRRQTIAEQMQSRMDASCTTVFASEAVNFALSRAGVHAAFDGNGNAQLHGFYRTR